MKKRPLPLHDVPVIVRGRGRERGGGGRDEIGYDRVHRDPAAGDQDAGLAGGPEVGGDGAGAQFAFDGKGGVHLADRARSEEHTSELQSLMRISYAVFCWKT